MSGYVEVLGPPAVCALAVIVLVAREVRGYRRDERARARMRAARRRGSGAMVDPSTFRRRSS